MTRKKHMPKKAQNERGGEKGTGKLLREKKGKKTKDIGERKEGQASQFRRPRGGWTLLKDTGRWGLT